VQITAVSPSNHIMNFTKGFLTFQALIVLTLVVAFSSMLSAGERIDPGAVQVTTPRYEPSFEEFEPNLGSYDYVVSWQGIPAAQARVEVRKVDGFYKIMASAKTNKVVDVLYRLRYQAEGLIKADSFLPKETVIDQRENRRTRNTQITFLENGEVQSIRSRSGRKPEVIRFNPDNFLLEPFSAAFLARSQPWSLGETKQFDTFNGNHRYLVSLTAVDKVTMDLNGVRREVWVVSPKVQKLTEVDEEQKLREARIYVTADRAREIIQIVSSVFVGNVTTRLVSYEPVLQDQNATHIARTQDSGLSS